MNKGFTSILMIIIFGSCSSSQVSDKEMSKAMFKAHFDQKIIRDISKYENLKIFLEKNIDTIINFRYQKNIVTYNRGEGKPDSIYLSDNFCYSFFQGNDQYDITNVPDYLKKELDSLFNTFNKEENISFEICKDKKISIEFKRERFENNLALLHTLVWNMNGSGDVAYNKDTVLANKCVYKIRLTELGR